jgi:molybdopterin biosynthesis enzyme
VIRETGRILIPILLDPKGKPKNPSSLTVSSDAPWSEILNQTLDQDVIMSEPGYPPYNASVMDGYAIRTNEFIMDPSKLNSSSSASGGNDWTHQVMDKVYAGDQAPPKTSSSSSEQLLPSAYYITTGAVVPDSYNCVVPIEECHVSPDKRFLSITTASTIQNQQWIRPIGCDIAAGSVVLPRGHCMDPVALGLLQQSGAKSIHIKRPIVVGVLSTGNELLLLSSSSNNDDNQQQQLPGKIPDVNRPILLSMLSSSSFGNCCETVDLGMERDDDVTAMARTMNAALETCDVIITTGGISMGETDIMEQVLVDHCHGTLHFGRMHMKPGM